MTSYLRDLDDILAVAPLDDAIKQLGDEHVVARLSDAIHGARPVSDVEWSYLVEEAAALADQLEQLALDAPTWEEMHAALNAATLIRVRAGGAARRGRRFEWDYRGSAHFATDPRGTRWMVSQERPLKVAITIADWDWPDWFCRTIEEAKGVAEEIYVRPQPPKRLAQSDVQETPLDPQPPFPASRGPCPKCGSSDLPIAVAAVLLSPTASADDAVHYYRCSVCLEGRPDLDVDVKYLQPSGDADGPSEGIDYDNR